MMPPQPATFITTCLGHKPRLAASDTAIAQPTAIAALPTACGSCPRLQQDCAPCQQGAVVCPMPTLPTVPLPTLIVWARASSALPALPMAIRMAAAVTALRPWPCRQGSDGRSEEGSGERGRGRQQLQGRNSDRLAHTKAKPTNCHSRWMLQRPARCIRTAIGVQFIEVERLRHQPVQHPQNPNTLQYAMHLPATRTQPPGSRGCSGKRRPALLPAEPAPTAPHHPLRLARGSCRHGEGGRRQAGRKAGKAPRVVSEQLRFTHNMQRRCGGLASLAPANLPTLLS